MDSNNNNQIIDEFNILLQQQWKFIDKPWSTIENVKYHRTHIKNINKMHDIKKYIPTVRYNYSIFLFDGAFR